MWLAENFDVEVVGITITEAQVELANRFAAERGLADRVRFELRDFCDTGLPDGAFDVVWAQESACHAPDKSVFLKEACRVLRPGGSLAVEDWFRTGRAFGPQDEACLHDWLDCWAIPDIETMDEFVGAAEGAGFEDVRWRDLTLFVRPSLSYLYKVSAVSFPPAWLAYRLGLHHEEYVYLNHVGALRMWKALKRRLWFDGFVHARKPSVP
jgi:SAM-dependent methyltransferase